MTGLLSKEYEVIVIGAGGAGLRTVQELAKAGVKVAAISKVFPTRSHTVSAQGGINAALGNTDGVDDWRWHMYDTVMGSDFLADQDAVEYMCKHAPATVIELEHMGLPFSRNEDKKIYQRAFGGQTMNYGGDLVHRTCAAADRTGHAMLHALYQQSIAAEAVFLNEWYAIDLVQNANGVVGVMAIEMETGDLYYLKAKATVLATGGAGRIFKSTTNAHINTGDGVGMALRAGLPVQDLEFWQFHPTGIAGAGVLVTEGCRGEGAFLINSEGERYMERYAPHLKDLSCRDVVSRSTMMEIREGRGVGPNKDHTLLKLEHLGEAVINKRLPGIRDLAKTFAGVDPIVAPIPVVPTCHYMMGGVPTTPHGEVITQDARGRDCIVPGLYAAGECACVSVHGANRLGANSLLDIVVFGRAVGLRLNDTLKAGMPESSVSDDDIDKALFRLQRWENTSRGENPYAIQAEMGEVMQNDFGVFRTQENMDKGLKKLGDLRERLQYAALSDRSKAFNTARIEALELDNLMDVAYSTAVLATNRTESRGAHARFDCPERDDKKWLKHSLYYSVEDKISYRPVNMKPNEVDPIELKARDH